MSPGDPWPQGTAGRTQLPGLLRGAGGGRYLEGGRVVPEHLQDSGHAAGEVAGGSEEQGCGQAADGDQHLHLGTESLGLGPGRGAALSRGGKRLSSPTRHLLGHSAVTWLAMALGKH